jgi:phytoene desaturase
MLTPTLPITHPLAAAIGTHAAPVSGPRGRPHAVVIGSGFGGLAAAVRLGARGYRVTVLEALEAPGGRAGVHRQEGYTFDAGPTVITAPFLLEELWQLAGRRLADDVELRPVAPFYRVRFDDGEHFDYCGDAAAMREKVARFAPGDVAGYERFLAHSEKVFRIGFEQLGHVPFDRFTDMLKVAPDLMRLQSWRSVYSMAARCVKDERLRMVLTFQTLLVGGSPFATTSVYCLIAFLERRWGVHWAMGGTNRLVQGLVGLIEGQGNRVRCGARVKQILVEARARRRRAARGRRAHRRRRGGVQRRLGLHLPPPAGARAPQALDRRQDRARQIFDEPVRLVFRRARPVPDVPHHTIALGPRYRGLIDDIFDRKHLAEDFSLYLHRPTATDPSLAPAGCDTFYALSPVPHQAAASTGRSRPSPTAPPSSAGSRPRCCRGWAIASSPSG